MRKTKFQRFTAFLLCLMMVFGSFSAISVYAADNESSGNSNGSSTSGQTLAEIKELLNAISYEVYTSEHKGVAQADEKIVIDAANRNNIVLDKTDIDIIIGEFGGKNALFTPGDGYVTWKVNIPKTAKYTMTIEYYPINKCDFEDNGDGTFTVTEYDASKHSETKKWDVEAKAASMERVLKINGKVPFAEARYLSLSKNWTSEYRKGFYSGEDAKQVAKDAPDGLNAKYDDGVAYFTFPEFWTSEISTFCQTYGIRFFKNDINSNELRSEAVQVPVWTEYDVKDSTGYYSSVLEFVFEEGENTITLEAENEPMAIKSISLSPAEKLPGYSEYKKQYKKQPDGKDAVKIEGEFMFNMSDKTIYPTEDRSCAANSPSDASRVVLNVMGGEKWQSVGQTVSYKLSVDSDGMYDIVTRYRQNLLDGMFVNRALYIYSEGLNPGDEGYYNGIPFEEAKAFVYNYSDDWQVTKLATIKKDKNGDVVVDDEGKVQYNEHKIFFKEGVTYTLVFEVTLGEMGELINTVQTSLDRINNDYLTIIQLTGATPDTYRDYGFSRVMPDTLSDMVIQAEVLAGNENKGTEGVADKLERLAGQKSSNVGTLEKIADLLDEIGRDEGEIARNLSRLKSYIGTLGTFISDAKTQPLQVDYIMVQGDDFEMPEAKPNFWSAFVHEVKGFFWSFFRDYDSMGATEVDEDLESIEVWLATGRDQSQVMRDLVNNDFTANENIAVDLKLVAGGTLLPSILAGSGPDVYLGLGQGDVINYAIRSAILPIDGLEGDGSMNDFLAYTDKYFTDAAMLVLGIENAAGELHYYGLPESQGFSMMFVRTDILADLELEIPKTWDDIMAAIPVLQAQNMEMGLSADYTMFLYQSGGELFADNGMRINLDSKLGLASFEKMCNMFTMYSFPYIYDAANRFRTGEMPIIIGDYTALYNQLKVFATEIEGCWQFVPLPGMIDENGKINNCSISAVAATVLVKGCEGEKQQKAAWQFMKWYTGESCQTEYSNEMVAILGPSAKHPTANKVALRSLPWTTAEYEQVAAQFENLAAVPNYPGSYILARYTNFAFLAAYNNGANPSEAMLSYINIINKEISRKRTEFGLETLEQGETLASKRLAQASAALEVLEDKESGMKSLISSVKTAIKSEDIPMLKEAAETVMDKTSVDKSVNIKDAELDIEDLTTKQLLYYVYIALSDAAAALATY